MWLTYRNQDIKGERGAVHIGTFRAPQSILQVERITEEKAKEKEKEKEEEEEEETREDVQ